MSSINVDVSDLDNVTADIILAPSSRLEDTPAGLKVSPSVVSSTRLEVDLTYASAGDALGFFYLVGTNYGAGAWANPHIAGRVTAIMSSELLSGPAEYFDRTSLYDVITFNSPNSWVAVDLGASNLLTINKCTLRNRGTEGGDNGRAIRNFRIQGSSNVATNNAAGVNAATWADIAVFANNTSMATTAASWGIYDIIGNTNAYRWIRILQDGVNALGDHHLAISEIELYGHLISTASISPSALAVFVDASTIKALVSDGTVPTNTTTPFGYLKFTVGGVNSWLRFFR